MAAVSKPSKPGLSSCPWGSSSFVPDCAAFSGRPKLFISSLILSQEFCLGWPVSLVHSISISSIVFTFSISRPSHSTRLTSPMSSSARPISRPGDVCGPPPHHRWLSVVHGCPLSVIGPSLLPLPLLGTVCLNTSRPHPVCLFSEDAWRLFSSGVTFLELVTASFVVPVQWLSSFLDT